MSSVIFLMFVFAFVIILIGYMRLLKYIEKQSQEMSDLRFKLFKTTLRLTLYESKEELNCQIGKEK